jgi:hypothetical protein
MTLPRRDYDNQCHRCGKGTDFARVTHACGCVYRYCLQCLGDDFSSWEHLNSMRPPIPTKDWVAGLGREHLRNGGVDAANRQIEPVCVTWDTATEAVVSTNRGYWSSTPQRPGLTYTINSVYSVTWLVKCPIQPEERHARILARLADGSQPERAFKRVRLQVVPWDLFCKTPELRR